MICAKCKAELKVENTMGTVIINTYKASDLVAMQKYYLCGSCLGDALMEYPENVVKEAKDGKDE